jgi:CheY-like chemotaxis protein
MDRVLCETSPLVVLVVDDNRDNADALSLLLQGRECRTVPAYNAVEAMGKAAAVKPDVVVLDLCMPVPNGIETCRRIREQSWAGNTVIVGITGSWIAQEAALKQGGFDAVFLKPSEVEPLRGLVSTLQRKRGAERSQSH